MEDVTFSHNECEFCESLIFNIAILRNVTFDSNKIKVGDVALIKIADPQKLNNNVISRKYTNVKFGKNNLFGRNDFPCLLRV